MRGFSILEVLIALAIAATGSAAIILVTFGTPLLLENARLEQRAFSIADNLLTQAEIMAREDFDSVSTVGTTTDPIYEYSLLVKPLYEGLAAQLMAHVSWNDTYGRRKEIRMSTFVTDPEGALDESCSPFVFGDWSNPQTVATYRLSSNEILPGLPGTYAPSDMALTRNRLLVAVSSTTLISEPSLFLFSIEESDGIPALLDSFDNASTSRMGFASVVSGGGYLYAANGFGSASSATCSTGACAQFIIFNTAGELDPVARLLLSTSQPPYAVSAGNSTTPGKSIAYRKGYVYLGLEKTQNGYEFNIIDVRNPTSPRWVGGIPVGRSVNDISIQGDYAYLASSDPGRELLIVNVSNPHNPYIVGYWNAPGSTNFGLGNVIVSRLSRAYLGRAYVGNAPEFVVLNTSEVTNTPVLYEDDLGTVGHPASVQGILVRDFLTAVLSGKHLQLWDTSNNSLTRMAASIELSGSGISLACRGNTLYVGSIDPDGTGAITLFTSS